MALIPVKGRENVYDVVVWTKETEDTPRRRMTRRVQGQRKAEQAQRDLYKIRDEGGPAEKPPTVAHYAEMCLHLKRHDVTAKTAQTYADIVKWYIAPAIGRRRLQNVTTSTVKALYADLRDRGLSAATVKHVHAVLSMIMQAAFRDDLIRRNPCDGALGKKKSGDANHGSPERGLEPDECKTLLADLEGTPVYAPSALAALTGLRRGEVLALKWEDVDLDGGELHVNAALEQTRGAVTRQQPKTAAQPARRPAYPRRRGAASAPQGRAGRATRLRKGAFWRDEGYMFPSDLVTQSKDGGRVWTPDAFSQAFRRAQNARQRDRLAEYVAAGGAVEEFEPYVGWLPRVPPHGGNDLAAFRRPRRGREPVARPCQLRDHLAGLQPCQRGRAARGRRGRRFAHLTASVIREVMSGRRQTIVQGQQPRTGFV